MLYGRPFVYVNDLFLDSEAQTLWSYTMATGQFQQDIYLWGVNQDPKDSKESLLSAPGTQVLISLERWVSKALAITYYLHCAWRPQSSGKVERTSQSVESATKKITQKETSLGWKEALPIALLRTHAGPKEQVGLSPYEMLYGRPFFMSMTSS